MSGRGGFGGGGGGFGGRGGGGGGRGGFGGGFRGRGRGRGDRGRGRDGRGGRRGRRPRRDNKQPWQPLTKLGRLVQDGAIADLDTIFLYSIKIKEPEIVEFFYPPEPDPSKQKLKDEVMKIKPVQKQTSAGQRTRFKAWVAIGDGDGHVGLGQKCAAEVATAIRGASVLAKLSISPVRRGYWGSKLGDPHTVPCKITGQCGSAAVRLIPAPRGTGLVSAAATKKILAMAGIEDVYTRSRGQTRTTGNFIVACFLALRKTYKILTPDLWAPSSARPAKMVHPLDKESKKQQARRPAAAL